MFERPDNRELGVTDLLQRCGEGWVPVGVMLPVAIAAHRLALRRLEQEGDVSAKTAKFSLKAVLMASATTGQEMGAKVEYLEGLPLVAWEWDLPGWSPEAIKSDVMRDELHLLRAFAS